MRSLVRKDSWLACANLNISRLLELIYFWSPGIKQTEIQHECGFVCTPQLIGFLFAGKPVRLSFRGPNVECDVNQNKFRKRKYYTELKVTVSLGAVKSLTSQKYSRLSRTGPEMSCRESKESDASNTNYYITYGYHHYYYPQIDLNYGTYQGKIKSYKAPVPRLVISTNVCKAVTPIHCQKCHKYYIQLISPN